MEATKNRIFYNEGDVIGNCIFIKDIEIEKKGRQYVRTSIFKCKCGKEFTSTIHAVKRGNTNSCGCLRKEVVSKTFTTHGHTKGCVESPEYRTWEAIRTRCTNKNQKAYKNYGGRGIIVCEKWMNSFEAFLEDMGKKPSGKHTIERINNNKNYSPDNCKWATRKEQGKNKRNTILIESKGVVKSLREWSLETGINYYTMFSRYKSNKPVEVILAT